jgi:hypothetical protein
MASMLEAETRGRESEAQARKAEEAAQAQDKEMVQVRKSVLKMPVQRGCLEIGWAVCSRQVVSPIQANNFTESALVLVKVQSSASRTFG